ncbi:MAG TPA: precorrin-8X methylmutase [Candidatus Choladousia intestinigallinarum]|nr:precorrin-8X methylmutase [Candidatus Choladousia intestinigallinarum]
MKDFKETTLADIERLGPMEIEKKSFELITQEGGSRIPGDERAMIIKRVIHTTADFDYIENLYFSPGAVEKALKALESGAWIVTDTTMALSGINKKSLQKAGGEARCFIGDEDVAQKAKELGVTRASVCVDKAADIKQPLIYAVGNAPTALVRLYEKIREGTIKPELIIGVPVGFVNVEASKELIMQTEVPCIVARGRKGGSNVAAAICNALLYMLDGSRK